MNVGRYDRRIRQFWTAEPQRGEWTHLDDEARTRFATETAKLGLNCWAKAETPTPDMPKPAFLEGPYVASVEWFGILGVSLAAFPTAKLRDKFVKINKGVASAIPDDAFWP